LPRVDDYALAFDLAAETLRAKDPDETALLSGAELLDGRLRLDFLGQPIEVRLEPVKVVAPGGEEVPLTDQVLILHYLTQADGRPVAGEWIAFREIPAAETYHPVFYQRAVAPLLAAFGQQPRLMGELAGAYPCRPGQDGDFSIIVTVLPRVEIMLLIWEGDEDFPAEAGILFDRSISGYLTAEDIAWLAGRVVYPLAGQARK